MTSRSLLALAAATFSVAAQAQNSFYLRDGDKVAFYGDSITDNARYATFLETFVLTRFQNLRVNFYNAGWSGDRVSGGGGGSLDTRLARDVFSRRPTVVTVMLGMNDGGMQAFNASLFDTYQQGIRRIVDTMRQKLPGVRLTLIQPSPFDDITQETTFSGGYNSVLRKYGDWIREYSGQQNLTTVDFNTPLVDALVRAKSIDLDVARRIIPDRIHPEPAGHLLMAAALLKAWNAPSTVTYVELDNKTRQTTMHVNSFIRNLNFGDVVTWTQDDEALPFPVEYKNPRIALMMKSTDLIDSLNQQILRVTNLPAEQYRLTIDKDEIGVFTREQLAKGINLATMDTPMIQQAWKVHDLTQKRAALQYASWRTITYSLADLDVTAKTNAERSLEALESEVIRRQRQTAKPLPRAYTLRPLPPLK